MRIENEDLTHISLFPIRAIREIRGGKFPSVLSRRLAIIGYRLLVIGSGETLKGCRNGCEATAGLSKAEMGGDEGTRMRNGEFGMRKSEEGKSCRNGCEATAGLSKAEKLKFGGDEGTRMRNGECGMRKSEEEKAAVTDAKQRPGFQKLKR